MQIIAISVSDPQNPQEVQAWLNNNTNVAINFVTMSGGIFNIFYTQSS